MWISPLIEGKHDGGLMVSFFLFVWLVFARTTGKTCVGKLPCFPYLALTRIRKGRGKVFIFCPGYFFMLPRFSCVVSAIDYSLLKHVVVINDDL